MLATNRWIYYDLEKTGCTFLEGKLKKICSGAKFEKGKKHARPITSTLLPKILTIRDPILWYFSLWSYGLDGKGKFARSLHKKLPSVAAAAYQGKNKNSFSYFLDFALSSNSINPQINLDLAIPFSCDTYTSRILQMIVPQDQLNVFLTSLNADFSKKSFENSIASFIPEIILRTSSLNQDFYNYSLAGKLDFLGLSPNWKEIFPVDTGAKNKSTLSSANSSAELVKKYLSSYHESLIQCKSALAYFLIDCAAKKLKNFNS